MTEWKNLCKTASRFSFDPHDTASQLDRRGRYSVELDEEFPLLIKLFHYTSKQHTRGATSHDRLELFMPLDGPARFRMGEQEVELQRGDLLWWTILNYITMAWNEAIHQPGAAQMQHGRALMESRPFLTRIPDDSIIVTDRVPTNVAGAGRYHFSATRDEGDSYAMVYAPMGRKFLVKMDKINGAQVKAWWFNPRDGQATVIGQFPNTGEREFSPPDKGEMLDWVLVLDDAAKGCAAPGTHP